MKIIKFVDFINEELLNDTPETYISTVLSQLKRKIDKMFEYEGSEREPKQDTQTQKSIQKAKADQEVTIKISTPAKQDTRIFLYNVLKIIKSPLVENPDLLPQDFNERKRAYFTDDELPGFVYYLSGKPQPYLGYPEDFIIYAISQNMGKMMIGKLASKYEFIKAQIALG